MCVSMPSKHKMDQHSAARRRLCWTRPKLVPRPNPTEQPTPCELPRTLVPACLRAHRALYQVLQLTSQHANAFPCCPPHFPHIRPRRYHALWPLHPLAPPPCGSWRHHPQASLPISLASASPISHQRSSGMTAAYASLAMVASAPLQLASPSVPPSVPPSSAPPSPLRRLRRSPRSECSTAARRGRAALRPKAGGAVRIGLACCRVPCARRRLGGGGARSAPSRGARAQSPVWTMPWVGARVRASAWTRARASASSRVATSIRAR